MTKRKNLKTPKKEIINELKDYIRANASFYLEDENISSIGIGYKIVGGKKTDELSLQFTVGQKIELESEIEAFQSMAIPKFILINGKKIPTDVLERKYELSYNIYKVEELNQNSRKFREDPIFPGISICNDKGTAGTLGCIVFDKIDSTPYVLSNWHVLHGDIGAIGDNIVQPGPHDDNRIQNNSCGKLVRSHLGHAGDCAIASIDSRSYLDNIYGINKSVRINVEPELGDKVIKSGRTTNVTIGVVERIEIIAAINYGNNTGSKEIGCFEIGVDTENLPEGGEISMGGDSGSAWLIYDNNAPTDKMAGLHFAGESRNNPHEHALACYSKSVFEKLGIVPASNPEKYEYKGIGFNELFLGERISFPVIEHDSIYTNELGNQKIDHNHFSIKLNTNRKFAECIAWNIDGGRIKRISRKGINFKKDPKIPSEYQIGNELYKNNDLDRGHIARRADLVWGSLDEAKKANIDSFYYSNIAPQMYDFNRSSSNGIWGKLENAVFADADVEDLKVSVMSGPVFHDNDSIYRGIQLPREYFKTILYKENETLKAKSFVLTQNLNELEVLDLDAFKVYEVSLSELEAITALNFPEIMHNAIGSDDAEREDIGVRLPITNVTDIKW